MLHRRSGVGDFTCSMSSTPLPCVSLMVRPEMDGAKTLEV
jgi:hypothetical protein